MKSVKLPRVMIVGTGSGSGKTTVTVALLAALQAKKYNIAAFKCGPDYIDPMFHSKVMGIISRNLDLYLLGHDKLKYILGNHGEGRDLSVIEGVMGMYDGISFSDDTYSANHISRITETPELLVVNVKGKSRSVVANIKGYIDLHENHLKGVILNNCSKGMYGMYKKIIEEDLNISCFGYLPPVKKAEIGSRHLGLITADEIDDIHEKLDELGKVASESIDIEGILQLGRETEELIYDELDVQPVVEQPIKIGVAKDVAFSFYYGDAIDFLEKLGAEIVYFSPLKDKEIPKEINGLIFGGGYPEEYLEELMSNDTMKQSIREAAEDGMPIYGECGGFMYLGESITKEHKTFHGVGIVPGNSSMTNKLVRFGYKTLIAKNDNLLCKKGEEIKCHEFHYSETDDYGDGFIAKRPSGSEMDAIHCKGNVVAGYPHVHFLSNIEFPKNFVKACGAYKGWK